MNLKDIIPTLSIEDKLKEIYDDELSRLEKNIQLYTNMLDMGTNNVQEQYVRAIVEVEYHTETKVKTTKKDFIYAYKYFKDVCYLDELQIKEITKNLKEFDTKVNGISDVDLKIIFLTLNKREQLSHIIKSMNKLTEKYKTTKRDTPIINSLIRLINENNDTDFSNRLLDELAGYKGDFSKKLTSYDDIISYKLKRLNPKLYDEIVFNQVEFNKQRRKEYIDEYSQLKENITKIYKRYAEKGYTYNLNYLLDTIRL